MIHDGWVDAEGWWPNLLTSLMLATGESALQILVLTALSPDLGYHIAISPCGTKK